MLPDDGQLSTKPVPAAFADGGRMRGDLKRDLEMGGIALNDPSQGLLYQMWGIRCVENDVFISAETVAETLLFSRPNIESISLAFDQNMRPAVAFMQAGRAWLYWYDTNVNAQVFTQHAADITSIACCTDEKRQTQTDVSDVIVAYIRSNSLYYRQQRGRYLTEYLLYSNCGGRIIEVGMNKGMRLQFLLKDANTSSGLPDLPFLGDIVQALATRSGIMPTNIDVSELYDTQVVGFKCNSDGGLNKRIDALREMFFFDKSEHDRKIYFPRRGRNVVVDIPYIDLVADDPSALKETRVQESELPKAVTVNHLDPAGGFATNKQTSRRRSNMIKATKEQKVESEVVLTADQAMTASVVKLKIAWHEQQKFQFVTTLKYAQVVSADVVNVQGKDGNWNRIRVTERNDDHPLIRFEGVADAGEEVYASLGVGHSLPPPVSTTPGLIGQTLLEILNIPALRDQDDELGVYIAVAGEFSGWYGSQIMISTNDGATFYDAMQIETPATLGVTLTDVEDEISAEYPADQHFEVLVNYPLESITYDSLITNVNRCVLGDELIQFQFAVLLGMVDGQYHYRLSGLVRGRYATEVEFWPTGTRFVLLDSSIAFMQAQQWMLGREIQIKPVSLGLTEDETVATSYDYLEGVSQREFPVTQVASSRDGSNNVTVSFVGRPRLGIETAPRNGKYFAGYRVKFSNGHVVDTFEMTASYASAPTGISVQVCALNTVTGEGPYSTPLAV